MTYEEKRQLYLAISQMLADAGLNQQTVREIVEEQIEKKVDRAVNQAIDRLNESVYGGDYIGTSIEKRLRNDYLNRSIFSDAVKEELKNRVIKVVISEDAR